MSDNKSEITTAYNIDSLKNKGVIFDMDGTLVDNTPFHYQAWVDLFKKHNLPHLDCETYLAEISGVPIANTVLKYFGNDHDAAFVKTLVEEKQHLYQLAFKPHLKPIAGLVNFLADLKKAGLKTALATSSSIEDVDFIFEGIPIRQYFDELVTGNMVSQPKPSPQIFLKAAELLKTPPEDCIVFEDSKSGLKAGRNAGMKVAGITTANPTSVVAAMADMVINDYTTITPAQLAALFEKKDERKYS